MSPAERAFIARIQRHAAQLTPELAAAFLQAFARLRATLTEVQLARLIASASVERLIAEALNDITMERAFLPARATLRSGVADAVRLHAKDVPGAGKVGGQLVISFDVLSPHVIEAVRELDTQVMRVLKDDVREAVRQRVHAGLTAGEGPLSIARDLRKVVGLAPNQEQAVRNYRAKLEKGTSAALDYKLRDRHYDRLVRDGKMTPERIDKAVESYRKRMEAFHAQTVARSAALDAQRLGQHLSWQSGIDQGIVDENRLMRRWASAGDSRVRPEHQSLNGEVVRWGQPFSSGQMYVGQGDFNCRCLEVIFLARRLQVA